VKVTQEIVKVVNVLFGVNVEISVPRISTACSPDAIELKLGRGVVPDVAHVVTKFQIDRSRISAVPGFYKVVPSIYEDNISGDDDLVAVSNADGYGFPLGSQVEGPCGNVGTAWRCAGGRGYKL
jgi:hypothetical protein